MRNTRKTKYFPLQGGEDLVTPLYSKRPGSLMYSQNFECDSGGRYRRIAGYERFDGQPSPSDASYWVINFDAGQGEISEGDTVAGGTSGATGVALIDAVVESGSYAGSDAAGYLVLTGVSGTFQDDEALQVSAVTKSTANGVAIEKGGASTNHTSWLRDAAATARANIAAVPGSGDVRGVWAYNGVVYAFRDNAAGTETKMYKSTSSGWSEVTTGITLSTGGRFEFLNYNFYGHSGSLKMYGCDGVNKAFQFDGTTFTQLSTGMATDTPSHIAAFKKHLFLSFSGGSVQHSATGVPTSWTAVSGASEIGIGDEIVGLVSLPGDALAIMGRNTISILYGTKSSDWNLKEFSNTSGAIEWSLQRMVDLISLDDRGITTLSTTQSYGDFKTSSVSAQISELIDEKKPLLISSLKVKNKNQYRLFFSDNTGINLTFTGGKISGFTRLSYEHKVCCTCCGEDSNGDEILLIGSENGMVYELEKGTSFDGDYIEAYLKTWPIILGNPERKKRFFKVMVEKDSAMSEGFWGVGDWGDFQWGDQSYDNPTSYIDESNTGYSYTYYASELYAEPYTLQGVVLHYSEGGLER